MAMDRGAHRLEISGGADFSEAHRPRARMGAGDCRAGNGGWGAFDADNTSEYLNHIPFADHGALLDPPTADVDGTVRKHAGAAGVLRGPWSARRRARIPAPNAEADGSRHGRWGMNYIYGTWFRTVRIQRGGR
jgi:squalene-hopene/tetraprenyl-beta-curcumene cyclase